MWTQILALIAVIALLWWLFSYIKCNPKALSAVNLNKSFFTMGVLALCLIAFIGAVIYFLRH